MITLQELIYDISQIWREDNKASFEQKYFETKTSIEHYTEQLHKPVVMQAEGSDNGAGAAVASEGVGEANMSAGECSCKTVTEIWGCQKRCATNGSLNRA